MDDWRRARVRGGLAVVIDVIRFSTTVCALLSAGRRPVYVVETPRDLRRVPGLRRCDVYSELAFSSPGRHIDNSPLRALEGDGRRPAAICTTSGSRAVFACAEAERVLIGSFANLSEIARRLRRWKGPVRLVCASGPEHNPFGVEDRACALALADAAAGRPGLARGRRLEVEASPRVPQFLAYRPGTGVPDLALSLAIDSLPVVPEVFFLTPKLGVAEPT